MKYYVHNQYGSYIADFNNEMIACSYAALFTIPVTVSKIKIEDGKEVFIRVYSNAHLLLKK